jgi:hypothetical protein
MSTAEILRELPNLTLAEREIIRLKLAELGGEEWMDDGLLTPEEKALIEQRLAEHDRDRSAAIPWAVAEERLKARYGK